MSRHTGFFMLVGLQVRASLPPGVDGWGVSLAGLMGLVVAFGLAIVTIFFLLNRKVVPQVRAQIGNKQSTKKKPKAKMSVGESFTFLASSPYIRDLAMLVSLELTSHGLLHCALCLDPSEDQDQTVL